VVQAISAGFKWTLHLAGGRTKAGSHSNRRGAALHAQRAIDRIIAQPAKGTASKVNGFEGDK
jgi:hypothetical protein